MKNLKYSPKEIAGAFEALKIIYPNKEDNVLNDLFYETYVGKYDDFIQFAKETIIPTELHKYFDFDTFAKEELSTNFVEYNGYVFERL